MSIICLAHTLSGAGLTIIAPLIRGFIPFVAGGCNIFHILGCGVDLVVKLNCGCISGSTLCFTGRLCLDLRDDLCIQILSVGLVILTCNNCCCSLAILFEGDYRLVPLVARGCNVGNGLCLLCCPRLFKGCRVGSFTFISAGSRSSYLACNLCSSFFYVSIIYLAHTLSGTSLTIIAPLIRGFIPFMASS